MFDKIGDWRAPRNAAGQRAPLYIQDLTGKSPMIAPNGDHMVKLWSLSDEEASALGKAVGELYKYLPMPDETKQVSVDIQNLAIVLSTIIRDRIAIERLAAINAGTAPQFEREEANTPAPPPGMPPAPSLNGASERVGKPVLSGR